MSHEFNNSRMDPPRAGSTSRRGFLTGSLILGSAAPGMLEPTAAADPTPVNTRLFTFVGGKTGEWAVISEKTIVGEPLSTVERLHVIQGNFASLPEGGKWIVRGVTSNERYSTRAEKNLIAIQKKFDSRPTATCGAFIPIRKSTRWWELTQDERRAIFQERSKHITIGRKYLPAIARRLMHCRDLSEKEPFDFLTIFDFEKADTSAFDDMMAELRATEEWKYVDREYDIRLVRVTA